MAVARDSAADIAIVTGEVEAGAEAELTDVFPVQLLPRGLGGWDGEGGHLCAARPFRGSDSGHNIARGEVHPDLVTRLQT